LHAATALPLGHLAHSLRIVFDIINDFEITTCKLYRNISVKKKTTDLINTIKEKNIFLCVDKLERMRQV